MNRYLFPNLIMDRTITKRELANRIYSETGSSVSQAEVYEIVRKTFDYIAEALVKGNRVVLRNFGVFAAQEAKPKVGRNPRTPEKVINIPAHRVVKFKSGKELRQALKEEDEA